MTFDEIISAFPGVDIVCIGDIMLDRFVYGEVERISPEAPVPVLRWTSERETLGGVGNVAANLRALGARASVIARAGDDFARARLEELLAKLGAGATFVSTPGVPTTLKTRFVSKHNHLLRMDRENVAPPDGAARAAALAAVERAISSGAKLAIVSDYAKGFLVPSLLADIIALCRQRRVPVFVDPKGVDYSRYAGATLVKPNRRELEIATGRRLDSSAPDFIESVIAAARDLIKSSRIENALVTLSERGMVFVPGDGGEKFYLPTEGREVYDVSGAGDTTIASLAATFAAGAPIADAMAVANAAAGIVVGKVGTSIVTPVELAAKAAKSAPASSRKIFSLDALAAKVAQWKAQGLKVGFTNGCFDCLHSGHLYSLEQARLHCDRLVVALNSDSSVKRLKGPSRPIQNERTRAEVLAALEATDAVVVFTEDTALALVERLRPDVIAKEGYRLEDWPEAQRVVALGGKAVTLKRLEGFSTTEMLGKAAANAASAATSAN